MAFEIRNFQPTSPGYDPGFTTLQDEVRAFLPLAETSRETFAILDRETTPVNEVLMDASPFVETPERVEALVDGLQRVGRNPEDYLRVLERGHAPESMSDAPSKAKD